MRNETRFTMASPSSGFAARVLARIEDRERQRARRRALIGIALLAVMMSVLSAIIGAWLIDSISEMLHPEAVAPLTLGFSVLFDGWFGALQALWITINVMDSQLGEFPILIYAAVVLAMTTLWASIAAGRLQPFSTIRTRG